MNFNNIVSAFKRSQHFAQDCTDVNILNEQNKLCTQYSNFKFLWNLTEDYFCKLLALDWWCTRINKYCDTNKISEDVVAKKIFHDFVSNDDYKIADYSLLTTPNKGKIEVDKVVDKRFSKFQEIYKQTLKEICGIITASSFTYNGLDFIVRSPVSLDKLKSVYREGGGIGVDQDFDYSEYETLGIVKLNGKVFNGFKVK